MQLKSIGKDPLKTLVSKLSDEVMVCKEASTNWGKKNKEKQPNS